MTWRPLPRDGGGVPRRLRESLDVVARDLGAPPAVGAAGLAAVFASWPEIAGPAAAHTRPVKLDGATLVVAVESAAHATEVRYRGEELLARLLDVVGPGVERVQVRVQPRDERGRDGVRGWPGPARG